MTNLKVRTIMDEGFKALDAHENEPAIIALHDPEREGEEADTEAITALLRSLRDFADRTIAAINADTDPA